MEKVALILTLVGDKTSQLLVAIKAYFKDVRIENVGDLLQDLIFPIRSLFIRFIRRVEECKFSEL